MWRVIGFFVLALALSALLGHVPLLGPLFQHSGLLGILVASAILSAVLTRIGERLLTARKLRSDLRALQAVGNAYNHGKIGSLYLARGRARAALEPLEAAVRGEPEVAEWRYRLGLARLATRAPDEALAAFEGCVALDEEYAYGVAQLRRALCLLKLGRAEQALEVLALFERNHGPSPESAFRRGVALRALGRSTEARAAFDEVGDLARRATRYQRHSAGFWALRAGLRRWV